jgi:O-acetyl-ADP-ribose deacetylase (regulator of RNase III)
MSITYHQGNLLTCGADALLNPVNCVGVMGQGLAAQFKRRFPANFQSYKAACARGEVRPGRMFTTRVAGPEPPHWIINFPTKRHWREPSRPEDVQAGLWKLVAVILDLQLASLAVPPLGAGLGGLAWPEVHEAIELHLAPLTGVDVRVFPPWAH